MVNPAGRAKNGAPTLPSRFRLGEESDDAGEAVDERPFADRADFAVAEEAGGGERAEILMQGVDVVVGRAIHAFASAHTTEQHRAVRPRTLAFGFAREQGRQIFRGTLAIADLELHGLAGPQEIAHRQRAGLWVVPDEISDEEIATAKFFLVLVDDAAEEQGLASMRAREKSSISRPCTISQRPPEQRTGNDEIRPSATPYEPSDTTEDDVHSVPLTQSYTWSIAAFAAFVASCAICCSVTACFL